MPSPDWYDGFYWEALIRVLSLLLYVARTTFKINSSILHSCQIKIDVTDKNMQNDTYFKLSNTCFKELETAIGWLVSMMHHAWSNNSCFENIYPSNSGLKLRKQTNFVENSMNISIGNLTPVQKSFQAGHQLHHVHKMQMVTTQDCPHQEQYTIVWQTVSSGNKVWNW